MKNVPRMMDYERVVSFDSALGIDMMHIINKPKEQFNGSISNLLHLIERSFDWSKSLPGDKRSMRYDIPMYTLSEINDPSIIKLSETGDAYVEARRNIPAYIDMHNLPQGYCENKYVQSYLYQMGARMLVAWTEKENLTAQDIFEIANDKEMNKQSDNYFLFVNNMNKVFIHLYHLWKFYREEQNFFVLDDQNLIDALANTEYDCRTDWLKSPNDSIYIMLPKNDYNVEGMYVNLESTGNGNKYFRIYMPMRPNKKDRNMHPLGYGSYYWSNEIKKSMNLQESIREGIANSVVIKDILASDEGDELQMESIMTYYSNLAAQVILYITSENREAVLNRVPKETININRRKKFINREKTQTDYWALGGNNTVYIGKPKRVNPKDGTLITNKGTGKKLNHLSLVPAHFHGYWLKDPNKIAELKEYQIVEEKYDDMGKRMVLYKRWLMSYYKGQGELIIKERKITTGGYEKEYVKEKEYSE